jgi:hypothetical protein
MSTKTLEQLNTDLAARERQVEVLYRRALLHGGAVAERARAIKRRLALALELAEINHEELRARRVGEALSKMARFQKGGRAS